MAERIEFVSENKELYSPPRKPVLVDVPCMNFLVFDGTGAPESDCYQKSVGALYTVAYAIKMSKMGDWQPPGYQDFKVPPLEGLWTCGPNVIGFDDNRDEWVWTSMLRLPEYVDQAVLDWAVEAGRAKKPEIDFTGLRLEQYTEGLCVQMMHIGPYSTEPETLAKMHEFMEENGYITDINGTTRRHHELYLGDPRRTAPERRKTVLRHPVRKA